MGKKQYTNKTYYYLTTGGSTYETSKDDVDAYGWEQYASDYPDATVRMTNGGTDRNRQVPLKDIGAWQKKGYHVFSYYDGERKATPSTGAAVKTAGTGAQGGGAGAQGGKGAGIGTSLGSTLGGAVAGAKPYKPTVAEVHRGNQVVADFEANTKGMAAQGAQQRGDMAEASRYPMGKQGIALGGGRKGVVTKDGVRASDMQQAKMLEAQAANEAEINGVKIIDDKDMEMDQEALKERLSLMTEGKLTPDAVLDNTYSANQRDMERAMKELANRPIVVNSDEDFAGLDANMGGVIESLMQGRKRRLEDADRELVDTAARSMGTVKGEANILGLQSLFARNKATIMDPQDFVNDVVSALPVSQLQQVCNQTVERYLQANPAATQDELLKVWNRAMDNTMEHIYNKVIGRMTADEREQLEKYKILPLMRSAIQSNFLLSMTEAVGERMSGKGGLAAERMALGQWGNEHAFQSGLGAMAGMATDPTNLIPGAAGTRAAGAVSKYAANHLVKGATNLGARALAMNYNRLGLSGAKILGAGAGGAANFGLFEIKNAVPGQFGSGRWDLMELGETGLKGALTGFAVGGSGAFVGSLGNAAMRVARPGVATAVVKGGTYAGKLGTEAGVFAITSYAEDPDKGFANSCANAMLMVLGMRMGGMLKDAPKEAVVHTVGRVSGERSTRQQEGLFAEMWRRMSTNDEVGLTAQEQARLSAAGYGDLEEMMQVKSLGDVADHLKGTKELSASQAEGVDTFYERVAQMLADPKVPEVDKAKMYYIVTGKQLGLHTVTRIEQVVDPETGDVTVRAWSGDRDGAVGDNDVLVKEQVYKRGYNSKKAVAEGEHQVEMNRAAMLERDVEAAQSRRISDAAVEAVAAEYGVDRRAVESVVSRGMSGAQLSDAESALFAKAVEASGQAAEAMRDDMPVNVRADMKKRLDVDIEEALATPPAERDMAQRDAVEKYMQHLLVQAQGEAPDESGGTEAPGEGTPMDNAYENGRQSSRSTRGGVGVALRAAQEDFEKAFGSEEEFLQGKTAMERIDELEAAGHKDTAAIARDYFTRKEYSRGIDEAIEDEARIEGRAAADAVSETVHSDGTIKRATLRGEEPREVFVTDGEVSLVKADDGTLVVDREGSADTVIVKAADNGEVLQVKPEDLAGVEAPVDAAMQIEGARAAAEEAYRASAKAEADGTLDVREGADVAYFDGERIVEAKVVGVDEVTGTAILEVADKDGKPVQVAEKVDTLKDIYEEIGRMAYRKSRLSRLAGGAGENGRLPQEGERGEAAQEGERGKADTLAGVQAADESAGTGAQTGTGAAVETAGTMAPGGGAEAQGEGAEVDEAKGDVEADMVPVDENEPLMVGDEVEFTLDDGRKAVGEIESAEDGVLDIFYQTGDGKEGYISIDEGALRGVMGERRRSARAEGEAAVETAGTGAPVMTEGPVADKAAGEVADKAAGEVADKAAGEVADEAAVKTAGTGAQDEGKGDVVDNESGIPLNAKGKPEFHKAKDAATAWDALVQSKAKEGRAPEKQVAMASEHASIELKKAEDDLKKAEKLQPRKDEDTDDFLERRESAVEEAQQRKDMWEQIAGEQSRRNAREALEKQSQRRTKAQGVGEEVSSRWNNRRSAKGRQDIIRTHDGKVYKVHYEVVEAGDAVPSHDPLNGFVSSDGFPRDRNGNNVNDRDYEHERAAQQHTERIASEYNEMAIKNMPIVSEHGVVVSGNERTMARILSARGGTDKEYTDYLEENLDFYGIDRKGMEGIKHPQLVAVLDEPIEYTTENFRRFNKDDRKEQDRAKQSVAIGKALSDDTYAEVLSYMRDTDSMSAFYSGRDGNLSRVLDSLVRDGVITQEEKRKMAEQDGTGALTGTGEDMIESALIGKAFEGDPATIDAVNSVKSIRKAVIMSLPEIGRNRALGADYSLESELSLAVRLTKDARTEGKYKQGMQVSEFANQLRLFGDDEVSDYRQAAVMLLADVLNSQKPSALRAVLEEYNARAKDSAAGQATIDPETFEVVPPRSKVEVLRDLVESTGINVERIDRNQQANDQYKNRIVNESKQKPEETRAKEPEGSSGNEGVDKTRYAASSSEEQRSNKEALDNHESQGQDQARGRGGLRESEHTAGLSDDAKGVLDAVGKQLGLDIRFAGEEEAGGNGHFNPGRREIVLNAELAAKGDDEVMQRVLDVVFGHEVTHGLKQAAKDAPELWNAYRDLVREWMGADAFDAEVRRVKEVYDRDYEQKRQQDPQRYGGLRDLTLEEVEEEVLAEHGGRILASDRQAVRALIDRVAQSGEKPTSVVKRMLDWIDGMLKRLRSVWKGTPAEKAQEQRLEAMRNAWEGMYEYAAAKEREEGEARATTQAQRVAAEVAADVMERETDEGGERFSTSAMVKGVGLTAVKDDGEGNVAFYDSEGNKYDYSHEIKADNLKRDRNSVMSLMMDDALKAGMTTEQKADKAWDVMASMLNMYLREGAKDKGGFANMMNQWQWMGETVFKAVAMNSDKQYGYSIDITRVCKKNEAVINSISEMQKRMGYGITPGQVMEIYLKTNEAGYQVPCPVCYVFSRYIRNGKYATIMVNGQRKYGHLLVDPKTLSESEKKERVQFWLDELKRVKAENKSNENIIKKANEDITELLGVIDEKTGRLVKMGKLDEIGRQLTDPRAKLSDKERKKLEDEVRRLDARYRAAVNVVAQSSLDGWIKQFAIRQFNGKNPHWELWDDTYNGYPEEIALDLRRTAEAMRAYPGVQRFRKTRGAAAGKEIHMVADNAIGDVPMMLGSQSAVSEMTRPREMSDQEWDELKGTEEGKLQGGEENLYVKALKASDEKTREKLLANARKRLEGAHVYALRQSLRGGQRMWSWSDNIERLSPDVVVNLMQLEMLGGALQTYSKQLEGVKLVAALNGYVNGSLMAKGNGYREVDEADVYTDNGKTYLRDGDFVIATAGKDPVVVKTPAYKNPSDGKWYVLEFDDVVGISPFGSTDKDGNHLKGLFELNREYDKAGNIMVGMNDLHIRMCLADDRLYFVIPWHSSGANAHILKQMYDFLGVAYNHKLSRDYTDVQEEKLYSTEGKVPRAVTAFWNDHYNNPREITGYGSVAGKDFRCGIKGGVESGKGRLSESQKHYRELRDAILVGVNTGKGVVPVEEARPEWMSEINGDEFLSQVLRKVRGRLGKDGFMTTEDCRHVYPYEYWDEASTFETADINGARYLEYCRRLGLKPKFVGKLKGKPGDDFGNFADDHGYWKVLIDRRMYDREGRFQDLDPVNLDGFSTSLVDPKETAKEFEVTRVADEEAAGRIVDDVMEMEKAREGGVLQVNYDTDLASALDKYKQVRYSVKEKVSQNRRLELARESAQAALVGMRERSETDLKALQEGRNAVARFIRKALDARDMPQVMKSELNSMMSAVKQVRGRAELERNLNKVEGIVLDIDNRTEKRLIDKLLGMKILDKTGKGISKAKGVDDDTRQVLETIRQQLRDGMRTDLDGDLSRLGSELYRLYKDRREGRTVDENEIQALRDERARLLGESRDLIGERAQKDVAECLAQLAELKAKMYDCDKEFTDADALQMDALQILDLLHKARALEYGGLTDETTGDRSLSLRGVEARLSEIAEEMIAESKKPLGAERTEAMRRLRAEADAMEQAALSIKTQQNDLYAQAREALSEAITTGREMLKDQLTKQAERRRDLARAAWKDIDRGKRWYHDDKGRLIAPEDLLKKGAVKRLVHQLFGAPLDSLDYMTQVLSTSQSGQGFLYKQFIEGEDGVVAAHSANVDAMRKDMERLDAKCKELTGMRFKALSEKHSKPGDKTGIMVTDMKTGRREELGLSRGSAMYAMQLWDMRDGRMKLEKMGFDQDSIDACRAYVGEDLAELADWMVREYYPEIRERLNARHKEIYLTSMAKVDNYVPICIDPRDRQGKSDMVGGSAGSFAESLEKLNGSLVNRTVNTLRVDLSRTAFDVLAEHTAKNEEWIAYARVRQDLDSVLSSRAFANTLNRNSSGRMRDFEEAARLAVLLPSESGGPMDSLLRLTTSGVVSGAISYKVWTAMKQLLSYPAFFGYSQNPKYLGRLMRYTMTPVSNYMWAKKNLPSFRKRIEEGLAASSDLYRELEGLKDGQFKKWLGRYAKTGMIPNKFVDAITCGMGVRAIYEHEFARLKNKGMDSDTARRQALLKADVAYNQTQQSNIAAMKSAVQQSQNIAAKLVTTFQQSNIGFTRKAVLALNDLKKGTAGMNKQVKLVMEREGVDEKKARKMVLNQTRKAVVNLGLYGWGLKVLWGMAPSVFAKLMSGWQPMPDDDEEEQAQGAAAASKAALYLGYMMQGTVGGNILHDGATTWNPLSILTQSEVKDLQKVWEEYGVDWPTLAQAVMTTADLAGIKPETWSNVAISAQDLMDKGFGADMSMDIALLLNMPKSMRKELMARRAMDYSPLEYAEAMSYAMKKDDTSVWGSIFTNSQELKAKDMKQYMEYRGEYSLTKETKAAVANLPEAAKAINGRDKSSRESVVPGIDAYSPEEFGIKELSKYTNKAGSLLTAELKKGKGNYDRARAEELLALQTELKKLAPAALGGENIMERLTPLVTRLMELTPPPQ